jgi:hypothetical protein
MTIEVGLIFYLQSLREATHQRPLSMYRHFILAERVAIYFKFKTVSSRNCKTFCLRALILETIIDEDNNTKTFYSTSSHPVVLGTPSYATTMTVEDMLNW